MRHGPGSPLPGPTRYPSRRRLLAAAIAIAAGLILAGTCVLAAASVVPATAPPAGESVHVQDAQGHEVVLAAPARRVVALAPHATELVFAAGGGERLVGAVRYSDWPPAARLVPSVGDAWHLNAETLIGLRPDLVVAWLSAPVEPMRAALQSAGIPVFYTAPARLTDIADDVARLGTLLGTSGEADVAAATLRKRVRHLEETYAARTPVRVFIHAGSAPLYTLSDAHVVGDALRVCGAQNVFGKAGPAAPQVEMEALLTANPQVILTTAELGRDPLSFWRGLAPHLPAVRRGRVIALPADALYRPGPRLVDATEQLCTALQAVRAAR